MIGSFTYLKNRIIVNLEGLTPTANYLLAGTGSAWTTTNSPTLAGLDLTGITNGNIPYMGASGFADSPMSYDGSGNFILTSSETAKPQLQLINTNADNNEVRFVCQKDSANPEDNDPICAWLFKGNDSNGNASSLVFLDFYSSDVTDGDEAGEFKLRVRRDNSADVVLDIDGYNGSVGEGFIEFNQSEKDWDFIVNANTISNALVVEGSTGITSVRNLYPQADDTYYLGKNDDDTPFGWKGLILKDTTNGKHYRIQLTNGAVDIVDLTD